MHPVTRALVSTFSAVGMGGLLMTAGIQQFPLEHTQVPEPIPFKTRYYLVKSSLYASKNLLSRKLALEEAYQEAVESLGSVSPQAVGILVYQANHLLSREPENAPALLAMYERLIQRSPIGEGLEEELKRTSMAIRLASHLETHVDGPTAHALRTWRTKAIHEPPSYFPTDWAFRKF